MEDPVKKLTHDYLVARQIRQNPEIALAAQEMAGITLGVAYHVKKAMIDLYQSIKWFFETDKYTRREKVISIIGAGVLATICIAVIFQNRHQEVQDSTLYVNATMAFSEAYWHSELFLRVSGVPEPISAQVAAGAIVFIMIVLAFLFLRTLGRMFDNLSIFLNLYSRYLTDEEMLNKYWRCYDKETAEQITATQPLPRICPRCLDPIENDTIIIDNKICCSTCHSPIFENQS